MRNAKGSLNCSRRRESALILIQERMRGLTSAATGFNCEGERRRTTSNQSRLTSAATKFIRLLARTGGLGCYSRCRNFVPDGSIYGQR
jgi:hypothetical protein